MRVSEKFKAIRNNFLHKSLYALILSLITTLAFAVYNAYLGISFRDAFAIGISIYYFLLIWVKSVTLVVEKQITQKAEVDKTSIRIKNYNISSVFIFIIDLCLIAPIIIMAVQPKEVNFGIIPAITMATYSVYKIIFAIRSYVKSKKSKNATIILLKQINIIDAVVSILSLQHTLIMVNDGMDARMRLMSLITSIAFIGVIVIFSVASFLRNRKLFKTMLKL